MNSHTRTILTVTLAIFGSTGMLAAQVVPETLPTPAELPAGTGVAALPPETYPSALRSALESLRTLPLIGRSSSPSVLVVPSGELSIEELVAATEDMTVMDRIFRTKLGTASSTGGGAAHYSTGYGAMGSYGGYGGGYGGGMLLLGQGTQALPSLYLQGYGALFMMEVDYPLAPIPNASDEQAEDKTQSDIDPVWQQTRTELFHPDNAQQRQASTDEAPKYSAEKVEALIADVVESLKHASNIRALQSGDVVVVTITGRAASFGSAVDARDVSLMRDGTEIYRGDIPAGQFQTQTVMTIRAKTSDIKSFAAGDMDLAQFRSRVQVLTYPKLSPAAGTTTSTGATTGRW